eukprot:2009109-Pleurochrysis_carterae.AAC.3
MRISLTALTYRTHLKAPTLSSSVIRGDWYLSPRAPSCGNNHHHHSREKTIAHDPRRSAAAAAAAAAAGVAGVAASRQATSPVPRTVTASNAPRRGAANRSRAACLQGRQLAPSLLFCKPSLAS